MCASRYSELRSVPSNPGPVSVVISSSAALDTVITLCSCVSCNTRVTVVTLSVVRVQCQNVVQGISEQTGNLQHTLALVCSTISVMKDGKDTLVLHWQCGHVTWSQAYYWSRHDMFYQAAAGLPWYQPYHVTLFH